MSTDMLDTSPRDSASNLNGSHPGRWVVFAMFAFAGVMIGTLWIYSDRHTAPFRELTRALAAQFPDSTPKVEGGQRKMQKDTPRILRMILKVAFDPVGDERAAADFAGRVLAFARAHHDVTQYDTLEIHLFQLRPEEEIRQRTLTFAVADLPPDPESNPRAVPARAAGAATQPR